MVKGALLTVVVEKKKKLRLFPPFFKKINANKPAIEVKLRFS